jgi:hypothetical protein
VTATGSGHDRRVLAASLPENVASLNGHVPQQQPPADTLEAMTADTTVTSVEDVRVTVEADRLAALVRELTAENRELAAAAAVWQERARVLSDQLALAAPQSPPDASGATESPDPSGEEPVPQPDPFPAPLPPTPNERGWWKRLADVLGYGW